MTSVREKNISLADFLCLDIRLRNIVSFSPEKFQRIQFCVQVAVTTPKRENSRGEVVPETKDKIDYTYIYVKNSKRPANPIMQSGVICT